MVAAMTTGGPSEFGGRVKRNGVQPAPHVPDASEKLMLLYTTGDPSGETLDRDALVMQGLLPLEEQRALREAEGALEKGQVWKEMQS